MTPRSLVFLCIFLFALPCFATESYQARLAAQSVLLDIKPWQNGLIVVGERGHVLTSENAKDWQQEAIPSLATLTAVAVNQDKIWAVGHDAVILHKPAINAEWQVQQFLPDAEKPLLDILFFDDSHGVAIGAYGIFYRTRDGGDSWQLEMHPEFLHPADLEYLQEIREEDEAFYQEELVSILPHLNRISRDGDRLYIAGEAGLLAYSNDLGISWNRMEVDYEGSFFDIERTSAGLLAAGLRGNVYLYDQATESWRNVEADTNASFNSIVQLANGEVLLVGNNGRMMRLSATTNKILQTEEGQPLANAIEFNNSLVAVGSIGVQQLDIGR